MNTTPSTTDVPYTVVGATGVLRPAAHRRGLAAVVLNRGGRPTRAEDLARLEEIGFDEIVSVLDPQPHYDVEQLASRLVRTRFLILGHTSTEGIQVNMAMREVSAPHVLVTWSDVDLSGFTDRILERILQQNTLCVVPLVRTERGATVPSLTARAFYGSGFRTVPSSPQTEGAVSLYPYAGIGVFDRERFLGTGGYDPTIRNRYWQHLDFGFRAYLWGERITCLPVFRVTTARAVPPDDTTQDADYARFHLKNLSIRFSRDSARLPWRKCLPFVTHSGIGLAGGIKEFARICRWVKENRYRFVQDAKRVTELWEVDE
ncbi:MAG: hypothetical protein E4H09_03920 [Spirochaetales bacterium]|nr:MAG: hypothetical protein E4H09_03920 [Spirochaetales bacterium]